MPNDLLGLFPWPKLFRLRLSLNKKGTFYPKLQLSIFKDSLFSKIWPIPFNVKDFFSEDTPTPLFRGDTPTPLLNQIQYQTSIFGDTLTPLFWGDTPTLLLPQI